MKKASFLFLLLIFINSLSAQNKQALKNKTNDEPVRVGVAGSAPFIVDAKSQTGISLEIWQARASINHIDYNVTSFDNVPQLLDALESGNIDVAVGPITISSNRAKNIQFTQPYFYSGISIMSSAHSPNILERIKPFFNLRFLNGVLTFLFILAIVGTLLWLAERNKNTEQFPKESGKGIANGMWCAIVTMSTTGYGDRAPVTIFGRIVAGSWMVICIALATTMVASVSSSLTLSALQIKTIKKAKDLNDKNVGVVVGSPAEKLTLKYGGKIVPIKTIEDGYNMLKEKKIDAVVYDRSQLVYFLKEHKYKDFAISTKSYSYQGYGFALPIKSDRVHDLNIDILKMQESGRITRIINQWLGEDQ